MKIFHINALLSNDNNGKNDGDGGDDDQTGNGDNNGDDCDDEAKIMLMLIMMMAETRLFCNLSISTFVFLLETSLHLTCSWFILILQINIVQLQFPTSLSSKGGFLTHSVLEHILTMIRRFH